MKTIHYLALLIFSSIFFSSCKKESSQNLSNSPYYFVGTINGTAVKYEADDLNSLYGCGTSQPEHSIGYDNYDIYEGTVLQNMTNPYENSIYVHILKHFTHDPSNAERAGMVTIGSYNYGVANADNSTVNGASIEYYDANGEDWHSDPGAQTGSSFKITELVDNNDGTSGKIFKASFSCKLYNSDGTKSIQVTNAVVRGKILTP